jgi:organic anion transporter 5A
MVEWLDGRIVGWLDGQMVGWSNGWMVGWLDGRIVGWLNGRMVGLLIGWMAGCLDGGGMRRPCQGQIVICSRIKYLVLFTDIKCVVKIVRENVFGSGF